MLFGWLVVGTGQLGLEGAKAELQGVGVSQLAFGVLLEQGMEAVAGGGLVPAEEGDAAESGQVKGDVLVKEGLDGKLSLADTRLAVEEDGIAVKKQVNDLSLFRVAAHEVGVAKLLTSENLEYKQLTA